MSKVLVENPYHKPAKFSGEGLADLSAIIAFNEGVKADRKAVIEWLEEPCKEHVDKYFCDDRHVHRFNCPECMKELKGEYVKNEKRQCYR